MSNIYFRNGVLYNDNSPLIDPVFGWVDNLKIVTGKSIKNNTNDIILDENGDFNNGNVTITTGKVLKDSRGKTVINYLGNGMLPPIGSIIGIQFNVMSWLYGGTPYGATPNQPNYIDKNIWCTCDGRAIPADSPLVTNSVISNTPNISDNRFLMGGTAAGTGGTNTLPLHSHSGTTGYQSADHAHSGTTDGAGAHGHDLKDIASGSGSNGIVALNDPGRQGVNSTAIVPVGDHGHTFTTGGVNANHNHTITVSNGQPDIGTSIESRPKYITVVYVMRVN